MKCDRCNSLMRPDSQGHICTSCAYMKLAPTPEPKLPVIKTTNKKKPCKNDVNRIMAKQIKEQINKLKAIGL